MMNASMRFFIVVFDSKQRFIKKLSSYTEEERERALSKLEVYEYIYGGKPEYSVNLFAARTLAELINQHLKFVG